MKEVLCINGDFGPWRDMDGKINPNLTGDEPKEGEIYHIVGHAKMKDGVWCYSLHEFDSTDWFECDNFVEIDELTAEITEAVNRELELV